MQGRLKSEWNAATAYRRTCATLTAGAARRREKLRGARYYGPLQLSAGQRLGAARGLALTRCFGHGRSGDVRCINCEAPLCPECSYLLINGRPWCLGCGDRHRPSLLKDLGAVLWGAGKVTLLAGAVVATAFFTPLAVDVRVLLATLVGMIGVWALFFNDDAPVEVRVVRA